MRPMERVMENGKTSMMLLAEGLLMKLRRIFMLRRTKEKKSLLLELPLRNQTENVSRKPQ